MGDRSLTRDDSNRPGAVAKVSSRLCRVLPFILMMPLGVAILGCGDGQYPKHNMSIRIGALLPLSGDGAKYGAAARKGIEVALEELDQARSPGSRRVEVVFEDSQGDPRRAVDGFRKLVAVDGVPAVIGDLFSSATLAVAPIANDHKVVVLSPTSSAPEITNAGPFVFRNVASDIFEGGIMADFAYSRLGARRVAILYVNNAYGAGIMGVFSRAFSERGGALVTEDAFPEGGTTFRSQLAKANAQAPDAIYVVGYRELGTLLRQARELGMQEQFLSTVMFEDPEVLKIAGAAAEGVIYSARGYDAGSGDTETKRFVQAFRKKYAEEPDIFAALSYDAMRILDLAITRGGGTSEGIRDALLGIRQFPGAAGLTSFDENGDVEQPAMIKTVRSGKFIPYEGVTTGS